MINKLTAVLLLITLAVACATYQAPPAASAPQPAALPAEAPKQCEQIWQERITPDGCHACLCRNGEGPCLCVDICEQEPKGQEI